jgi:hypothetical protein
MTPAKLCEIQRELATLFGVSLNEIVISISSGSVVLMITLPSRTATVLRELGLWVGDRGPTTREENPALFGGDGAGFGPVKLQVGGFAATVLFVKAVATTNELLRDVTGIPITWPATDVPTETSFVEIFNTHTQSSPPTVVLTEPPTQERTATPTAERSTAPVVVATPEPSHQPSNKVVSGPSSTQTAVPTAAPTSTARPGGASNAVNGTSTEISFLPIATAPLMATRSQTESTSDSESTFNLLFCVD